MSLSDVSDLTELSSDEDDLSPSKTTRITAAKKNTREYKISGVLRPPRTTSYTARSLYDQIIDNVIDLDPEYQRDVVWPEVKQSGLIDSMLRNYYIPPIIFAVSTADDGSELRTCIDGKQRLTSIQRFVDGQIPHKDSFTNEKLWYKASATSARRKLLPKHLISQFANKQIVCVEYSDISGDQEREIFQRVQLGVALTPAERMQAIVGPWPTVIREIQSQVLGEDGFQGYLDWGHARGRDFQCLASIGYLIENHPKPAVPAAPALEKWLLKNEPVSPKLRDDLLDTFRVFLILARDQKYSGSLNQPTRVSPIEFVMIGLLIYLFRDRLSLTQLSSAIGKMRKDVRNAHQDIRANGRITKHMLLFMTKGIKMSELKSDGKGDKPAAGKPTKVKKRKRAMGYDDDSDEDEKEYKQPRKGTVPKAPPAASSTSKSSSKASGSASQKKLTNSKSNSVPTKLPVAESRQNKAPPEPRPPVEKTFKAPVTAKAPPPPPTSAPPATSTSPSLLSTQPPSLQLHGAISTNSVGPSPAPTVNAMSEVRLSSVVKSEPGVTALHPSSATLSSSVPAVDKLGPIRAAREAIRSNPGTQVQSPVTPYAEHKSAGSTSNPATRDPQCPGSSQPATSVPPQQNPTLLPNSVAQQFQINPSDVEALLRAHGLMTPQMPMTSLAALPKQAMAAVQSGLNTLSGVGTSDPDSSVLAPSQPMHSTSVNAAGLTVQSVPAPQYLPAVSQTPLYLPGQQSGFSNGTHPAPRHSLPRRPPSTAPAPAPINTVPRTDSTTNQPPPYSASSNGSFKDDRRYSDYDRRDYSRRSGSYDKDYRRYDSSGWRASSRHDNREERDYGWDRRGGTRRKP